MHRRTTIQSSIDDRRTHPQATRACGGCDARPLDMHMHAGHLPTMRTTVEITDRQRAKLLELAAERGTKGFSELVQEAIDAYLDSNAARRERVAAALAVLGSLSEREARDLETSVASVRGRWRAE